MRKWVCKRKKGDLFIGATVQFCFLIITMIVIGCSYGIWMTEFTKIENVDRMMTSTVKSMEDCGSDFSYSFEAYRLYTDLSAEGMTITSFSYPVTPVDYGENFKITVIGEMDLATGTLENVVKGMRNFFKNEDIGKVSFNRAMEGTRKW